MYSVKENVDNRVQNIDMKYKYLVIEEVDGGYDITKFSLLRKAKAYVKANGCHNPITCKILP